VQCSAVQCSAVMKDGGAAAGERGGSHEEMDAWPANPCSAVQCSAVQCSAVHTLLVQCSALQNGRETAPINQLCGDTACQTVRGATFPAGYRIFSDIWASRRAFQYCMHAMHIRTKYVGEFFRTKNLFKQS
jgi:hypothetical protein